MNKDFYRYPGPLGPMTVLADSRTDALRRFSRIILTFANVALVEMWNPVRKCWEQAK